MKIDHKKFQAALTPVLNSSSAPVFLCGLDRDGAQITLHIHDARSVSVVKLAAQSALRAAGIASKVSVVAHEVRALTKPRHLDAFVGLFAHETIIHDPTAVFGRAQALISALRNTRAAMGPVVRGAYLDPELRIVFVTMPVNPVIETLLSVSQRISATLEGAVESAAQASGSPAFNRPPIRVRAVTDLPARNLIPIDHASFKLARVRSRQMRKMATGLMAALGLTSLAGMAAAQTQNSPPIIVLPPAEVPQAKIEPFDPTKVPPPADKTAKTAPATKKAAPADKKVSPPAGEPQVAADPKANGGQVAASGSAPGLPAVSAPNFKIDARGGFIDSQNKGIDGAAGIVSGAYAFPIGKQYGLQIDAAVGVLDKEFYVSGGGQLFWRDPSVGLVGLVGHYATLDSADLARVGARGELYLDKLTLGAMGGYQWGTRGNNIWVKDGVFAAGEARLYATDNFMVRAVGGAEPGGLFVRGGVEFIPGFEALPALSIFFDGGTGANHHSFALFGLRYYFGPDKSLIRRHREDDPENLPLSELSQWKQKPRHAAVGSGP